MLKISARNQLTGTVSKVEKGVVNGDIWIDIGNGITLFANITIAAIEELQISPGDTVIAIIKSSSVVLTTSENLAISARNRLTGVIGGIERGAVNGEVKIQLPSGQRLVAIVTNETISDLGLAIGIRCTGLIKASQVIVAKQDHNPT